MGLFIILTFSTQASRSGRWKITHLAPAVEKKIHLRPQLQLPLPCEWISLKKERALEFCFDVMHKDANNKITQFSVLHNKQAGFSLCQPVMQEVLSSPLRFQNLISSVLTRQQAGNTGSMVSRVKVIVKVTVTKETYYIE